MELAMNNQMKIIDEDAINSYGIPGTILMENAGSVVVEEIIKEDFNNAIILCGTGNNGGDGFVVARKLHLLGKNVRVFILGSTSDIKGDAEINVNIIRKLNIQIEEIKNINGIGILEKVLKSDVLVIDAIYGTGLNKEIEGIAQNVIRVINNYAKKVISIDIPSGISGDNALPLGIAIEAHKTICLELPKIGNIMYPGADYNGELIVKKIGIPAKCYEKAEIDHFLIQEDMILGIFPKRNQNSHKGDFGKANIIAGSTGMTGAAILTSKAAMKTGLGLLKLYIPESLVLLVTSSIPEAVTVPLHEIRKGVMGITTFNKIIEDAIASDGVAIGPGCGTHAEVNELLKRLIQESSTPIVIDADGLNALAKNISVLEMKKSEIIVTPHPGEMARLIGADISDVIKDPIDTAIAFSKKYEVITVLKGSRTIIANSDGKAYININGNSGMATAGSGDVLTGIIISFIAQGLKPIDAAILGTYVHGKAGDIMMKTKGEHGLLAGDIVDGLGYTLKEISEKQKTIENLKY